MIVSDHAAEGIEMLSRKQNVRISHLASGAILAEGPLGWSVTPFEGNYYVSKRCLNRTFAVGQI
jgi:hypothetical protein